MPEVNEASRIPNVENRDNQQSTRLVQFTWKGVEVYFPNVVLTADLKEKADEALKQIIIRESTDDCSKSTSQSKHESEVLPSTNIAATDIRDSVQEITSSEPMSSFPCTSKSKFRRTAKVTSSEKNSKCKVCEREFKNKYLLKRHMKLHYKGNGNTRRSFGPCGRCGIRFPNSSSLTKHIQVCDVSVSESTHLEVPPSIEKAHDDVEMNEYTSEADLDVEEKNASKDEMITENVASKSIKTVSKAWGHIFLKDYEEKQQSLTDAVALNANKEKKIVHKTSMISTEAKRMHMTGENPQFKCEECGRKFHKLQYLQQHRKAHSRKLKNTTVSCDICQKTFSSQKQLELHSLTHMGDSTLVISNVLGGLIYSCKFKNCSHGFSHDEDLRYHIEKKHRSSDDLYCPQCGQDFDSEMSLTLHSKSVHRILETDLDDASKDASLIKVEVTYEENGQGDGQDDYVDDDQRNSSASTGTAALVKLKTEMLDLEDESFDRYKVLGNSTKRKQQGTKTKTKNGNHLYKLFKCELCSESFTEKETLSVHMWFHKKENVYCCSDCDARCERKSDLDLHYPCHETQQPFFLCYVCFKPFRWKKDSIRHVRKKHSAEKTYRCIYCPERFSKNDELTLHISKRHPEHRNFPCEYCGRRYAQKRYLHAHMQSQHGFEPVVNPIGIQYGIENEDIDDDDEELFQETDPLL